MYLYTFLCSKIVIVNPTFFGLFTSITSAFRSTGASKCGGFEASIANFLASYPHLPYRKLNLITSCYIVNYYTSVYFPTFIFYGFYSFQLL